MHFSTTIVATILSFAASSYAWAQAADGTWIANDRYYTIRGVQVHEACTTRNTNDIHNSGSCVYWTDGAGHEFHGNCKDRPGQVVCI